MATANELLAYGPAWAGLEKLPHMDAAEFERWVALLRQRTGMSMPRERKSFLVTSVGLRMREIGYNSYSAYYDFLTSGQAGNIEWMALVDRLTVHETRFFRDSTAIGFLEQECLPELCERVAAGSPVQLWSAGCSTGEEAFTLAMVVDHGLRQAGQRLSYGVTGTDISLYSLAAARQAVYPPRRFHNIPAVLRDRYCEPLDKGAFRIRDSLRRHVCFAQFNLIDAASSPVASMDIVYCQNVLIYFDRDMRLRILDGLGRALRRGGVLILGAGEVIGWKHPAMERVGGPEVLAFRRISDEWVRNE